MSRGGGPGVLGVLSPVGMGKIAVNADPRIQRVTRSLGCSGGHAWARPATCRACCLSPVEAAPALTAASPLTRPCAAWEYPDASPCTLCVAREVQRRQRADRLRAPTKSAQVDALPPLGPAIDLAFDLWADPSLRVMSLGAFAGPTYLVVPARPPRGIGE